MIYLIHQLVMSVAERHPDREAVRFGDQTLTYAELVNKSSRLAALLHERGVRRGDRVGIYQAKALQTPIALYGIMMAGAAYVPLDPSAPPARVEFVLKDCGIRHLITDQSKLKTVQALESQGLKLDCLIGPAGATDITTPCFSWQDVDGREDAPPSDTSIMEADLAYIIYTSGSTGTPKGIMHTHHSGLSYARWAADNYALRDNDRVANQVPLHFDISTFDYFATAVAGGTIVIVPESHLKFPLSYAQLLARHKVSVLFTVPFSLIQLLLRGNLAANDLSALRWIIFGGEPFPIKHLRGIMAQLPETRFSNMYGPAEVNGVTDFTVPPGAPDEDGAIPIGKMAQNTEARIVDEEGRPVEPGNPGELLVRSATMMSGYWGRPDLNQRAFFQETVVAGYAQVFYRTGDIVRDRGDGNLMFLGRMDRQVKIRGYRVELDEVEAALCAHNGIEEAAAYPIPDTEGGCYIAARVIAGQNAAPTVGALLAFLRERLPHYAIPKDLAFQNIFPRTTTGKIDRRALRAMTLEQTAMHDSTCETSER